MSQAGRALAYAFESGALTRKRAFFLRAEPLPPSLSRGARVDAEQSFRPDYLKLKRASARLEEGSYEQGLVLLTKHKEENFANVARAWDLLEPSGTLVCAGANDDGAASLQRSVAKVFGLTDSLSKFHCRVFWLAKGEKRPPDYWRGLATLQPVVGGWLSQPGLFSWDRIDDGSALLARYLPADLSGLVADFGCGWGYLAREILARAPAVTRIDLVDAEHRALEAAKANVKDARASFHWLDLASERPPATYDTIVCNPPFHAGRAAVPDLGQAVIEAAARALAPGGRLFMVANRGLPYEAVLKRRFASYEILADNNKFCVTRATR